MSEKLDPVLKLAHGAPIDMVLYCPKCGEQHIDHEESWGGEQGPFASGASASRWTNPPHKSHLCKHCGHQWRPADVPTNGVAAVKTKGENDSPLVRPLRRIFAENGTVRCIHGTHPDDCPDCRH